jgi:hypothetical protein
MVNSLAILVPNKAKEVYIKVYQILFSRERVVGRQDPSIQ